MMTPDELTAVIERENRRRNWFITIAIVAALVAIAAFAFSALTSTPAPAQSFNCSRVNTAAEATICDSDNLSRLDQQMERVYDRALARGETTRWEQRRFLARRNACGRSASCIRVAYQRRLGQLRD